MITNKQIKEDIQQLESLQLLTRAYGEIASSRMKKTRNSVISNREFQEKINEIFEDVRIAYVQEVITSFRRQQLKNKNSITFLAHNGKKVSVLLSSNTGFYGDIVRETFVSFLKEVKKENNEITIIGKTGLAMLLSVDPDIKYTFFELPDHDIKQDQLNEIIKHLVQYEEISIHFGKFQSVVVQKPTRQEMSAETPIEIKKKDYTKYIFEPSIEEILMFFEKQIFASVFEQTVRESQLAKFASRILAMNKAEENIRENLSKVKLSKLKLTHQKENRKQIESLASMNLWK